MKLCSKCETLKSDKQFYDNHKGSYCIECCREYNRQYLKDRTATARREMMAVSDYMTAPELTALRRKISDMELTAILTPMHPAYLKCFLSEMQYQTQRYLDAQLLSPDKNIL